MHKAIVISSPVKNGKLSTPASARIREVLESHEGKKVDIRIERARKHRSNMQNAYYWGVVIPIVIIGIKDAWGEYYTKEDAHDMLKSNHSYKEKVNEDTGEIIRIIQRTRDKSTVEMMEYIDKCKQWAHEWLDVSIPDPNEQLRIE